jgi:hypothetical protein
MAKIIKNIWPSPFFLVGFIDDDEQNKGRNFEGLAVLGNNRNLLKVIREQHVTDLIFSISGEMQPETFAAILQAKENGIEVITMPILYEELIGRVPIFLLEDDWILRSFVDHARSTSSYETLKRIWIFSSLPSFISFSGAYSCPGFDYPVGWWAPYSVPQERVGISGKPFYSLEVPYHASGCRRRW